MELVLRAAFLFLFLWVVMRVMGRRELAELSAFELVLVVVLGDVVQQGITQEDMSVTGAVLVVSTMALLSVGMSWVRLRFPSTRTTLGGMSIVIVRDGRLLDEALRIERMAAEDVEDAARAQGIADLADVAVGVLEQDGQLSFVTYDRRRTGSGGGSGVG